MAIKFSRHRNVDVDRFSAVIVSLGRSGMDEVAERRRIGWRKEKMAREERSDN